MTGLVIKSPWIDLIISGKKTWELRSTATTRRGEIALIKSKSGTIVGTCKVTDCVGPLTRDRLVAEFDRHRVPTERLDEVTYERIYAWVLSDPKAFTPPVPYKHPSGAVIWVTLTPENVSDYANLEGVFRR